MNILICKCRVWLLKKLFWLEIKRAWNAENYSAHLLRAAALLQQRQQLTNQQATPV